MRRFEKYSLKLSGLSLMPVLVVVFLLQLMVVQFLGIVHLASVQHFRSSVTGEMMHAHKLNDGSELDIRSSSDLSEMFVEEDMEEEGFGDHVCAFFSQGMQLGGDVCVSRGGAFWISPESYAGSVGVYGCEFAWLSVSILLRAPKTAPPMIV